MCPELNPSRETRARDAMPTRLFCHSLACTGRERGGAERAEGARSHAKKTLVQILYGSVTHQRVKNQGGGRSRRFHLHPGERRGWMGLCRAQNKAALRHAYNLRRQLVGAAGSALALGAQDARSEPLERQKFQAADTAQTARIFSPPSRNLSPDEMACQCY